MKEAEDLGLRSGQDIFGKSGKRFLAGASPVHHRGHRVFHPGGVRLNANLHYAVEDVDMRINEPGGDHLVLSINNLLAFLRGNIFIYGGNLISVYGNVHGAIDILRRVNYSSTLYQ